MAQLVRASCLEPEDHKFESHARHKMDTMECGSKTGLSLFCRESISRVVNSSVGGLGVVREGCKVPR